MDILKQYLESLFNDIPSSKKSLKVKEDLYNMMEDKYNSLIDEGYTKNEAIGKVISEFGSIEEIKELIENENSEEVLEEVYIENDSSVSIDKKKLIQIMAKNVASAIILATSVYLFIVSIIVSMIMQFLTNLKPEHEHIFSTVTICSFFGLVVLGVMCIFIAKAIKKYDKNMTIKNDTLNLYNNILKRAKNIKDICVIVGVFLFVISIIPVIVIDEVFPGNSASGLGSSIMLVIVGLGVWLIIATSRSYKLLKEINNVKEEGKSKEKRKSKYKSNKIEQVMECYWPTVTCLYLIVSVSLWYYWEYTWVIFALGFLVKRIIDINYKEQQ